MLNIKLRPGAPGMLPVASGEPCGACGRPSFKEGWCGRCYPLYGSEAWGQVGRNPKRKADV